MRRHVEYRRQFFLHLYMTGSQRSMKSMKGKWGEMCGPGNNHLPYRTYEDRIAERLEEHDRKETVLHTEFRKYLPSSPHKTKTKGQQNNLGLKR